MTRVQRYRYEMFVRVRNFGAERGSTFPEGSAIVGKFARVGELVTAIEIHLVNRALSTRGVKSSTKDQVVAYLRAIAAAARRVTGDDTIRNPFTLPARRNLATIVATARAFIEEASQRQDQFIQFGLPKTFIAELTALTDGLEGAIGVHLGSRAMRANAHAGLRSAMREGVLLVRDIDVLLQLTPYFDTVLMATWRAVRRIEGQSSSSRSRRADGAAGEAAVPGLEEAS